MPNKPESRGGTSDTTKRPVVCSAEDACLDKHSLDFDRSAAPGAGGSFFQVDETESILFALAEAVEQRDHEIAGHCEQVAFISVSLGIAMGLNMPSLQALYRGGYLHDIGKVGLPDSILFKPGKLTPQEWVIMRSHTTRGEEICRHLRTLAPVLPIIRHHHERWDGSGYPDGLQGDETPLLARILQMADIYDALISPRSYKEAMPPEQALRVIAEEAGRGWRDPEITDQFLRLHKMVVAKVADFGTADQSLDNLRMALSGIQHQLV
jgi:putative two-component system response regulator